jgi:hypothetical protein
MNEVLSACETIVLIMSEFNLYVLVWCCSMLESCSIDILKTVLIMLVKTAIQMEIMLLLRKSLFMLELASFNFYALLS